MPIIVLGVSAVPIALVWNQTVWSGFETPAPRVIVCSVVGFIAWTDSAYAPNYYFGRLHLLDRSVVVLLALGVVVHPVFLPAFVLASVTISRQFTHPDAMGQSWSDRRILYDFVTMGTAYIFVRGFTPASESVLLTGLIAVVAAAYFYSGLAKVRLSPYPCAWVFHNRSHRLVFSSRCYGWLWWLSDDALVRVAATLRPLNVPLQLVTLVLELGVVFLLADERVMVGLLAGLIAMHVGIFAVSGICFWKWITLDILLATTLLLWPHDMYGVSGVAAMALAVVSARIWSEPPLLGWYDTNFVNLFRLESVEADGSVREIGRTSMVPYDLPVGQSRFFYLLDQPVLVGTYGALTRVDVDQFSLTRHIEQSEGRPDRIEELKRDFGVNPSRPDVAARFERFIREYFIARRSMPRPWLFSTPVHLFSRVRGDKADPANVQHVRVRAIEYFHDDKGIRVVSDQIVLDIVI
ncbi:MAG: hypothetical protein IID31_10040 [Planctomycetes bacterium]|nr:hypothetical protein [Planctomycetota bacterium]